MDIAFVKYKEFKELRDINEAKIKITEAFYLVSTTSRAALSVFNKSSFFLTF